MNAAKLNYCGTVLRGIAMSIHRAQISQDTGRRELVAAAATLANVLGELGLPQGSLKEAVQAVRDSVENQIALETTTEVHTAPKAPDIDGGLKVRNPAPAPRIPPRGGMVAPDLSSLPSL